MFSMRSVWSKPKSASVFVRYFGKTWKWLSDSSRGGRQGTPENENSNISSQNSSCSAVSSTNCWCYTAGTSIYGWIFPFRKVPRLWAVWMLCTFLLEFIMRVSRLSLCLSVPGGEVWREESRCVELWSHPVCTFSGEWWMLHQKSRE